MSKYDLYKSVGTLLNLVIVVLLEIILSPDTKFVVYHGYKVLIL